MYSNIINDPSYYKVGIYIRLSESDEDKNYESESESIINQRNLLMNYVKQNRFNFIAEYVDDGFTGTNFDRPGFKKLINDVENNKINTIITKDLSRLGRDYIQCGYYVEEYFPSKKIRYISILDQIDTFLESANNDIAPFKALFNDMASKDTSKKIRSILKSKKEQGKFIGSEPCYGYMRDPLDKGHLIPNPEYAPIVKKIFEMADDGIGISQIASYLNSLRVKTPSSLKRKNINSRGKYNETWTISSINKILKNKMYTGDMVQNIQTKLSYKSLKKIALEKSFWIIVENTHEPLVSKIVYERIQNAPCRNKKTYKNREKRLFENLIYCKECGNALTITCRRNKSYWTVNCNKYSRDPKRRLCEPHFMPYDKLEIAILERIKVTCKKYFDKINIKLYAKKLFKNNLYSSVIEEKKILTFRINELQKRIDMLYEDRFKDNISIDTYLRLSKSAEKDLKHLKNEFKKIIKQEEKTTNIVENIESYEEKIKKLLDIENPSRELIKSIVDKIYIDKDKNIEIIYNFNKKVY